MALLSTDIYGFKDSISAYKNIYIIADSNTRSACFPVISEFLSGAKVIEVEAGEIHKNLDTAQQIMIQLVQMGADRHSLLVGLGGGMITDLTGFVADIYMRGIEYILIPTSLLAMVDAAIGGKTGVNISHLKNMAGTFSNPKQILIHPTFLKTLPERELRSGFAEMLKLGLIASPNLWHELLQSGHHHVTEDLILKAAHIKKKITDADPTEQGIRRILNFGHTVGHALESYWMERGEDLHHGEAVALGMMEEIKLSVLHGGLEASIAADLINILEGIYHSVLSYRVDPEKLISYMKVDKKNRDGIVKMIYLKSLGEALYT